MNRLLYLSLFLLLAGLSAALLQPYLFLDFWNDELYTLRQFVLRPAAFIATDYHVPNNHVLFNLLSHFYLQALGVHELGTLLEQPWQMRLLPAAFTLAILLLLFRLGARVEAREVGLLAGLLLITTHAYQAFALQIRGYGLGALLLAALFYSALSYFRKGRFRYLPGVTATAALALYTLPSNLYFLLGAMLGSAMAAVQCSWQGWRKGELNSGTVLRQRPAAVLAAAILGAGIGLLLYTPVFGQVFFNPYVTYEAFRWQAWTDYPPRFAEAVTGGRWLLLLPLPLALWGRSAFRTEERWVLWCMLLTPFLLAFVLGNPAPIRIFVVAFPLALLLWADGLYAAWRSRSFPAWAGWGIAALAVAYCCWAVLEEGRAAADHLMADIQGWERSQNLEEQYYSAHYHPMQEVARFHKNYFRGDTVLQLGCEPHGLPAYLEHFQISYLQDRNPDSLLLRQADSLFVFTNHPNRFADWEKYEVEHRYAAPSYHCLLLLRPRPAYRRALEENISLAAQRAGQAPYLLLQHISPVLLPPELRPQARYPQDDNLGVLLQRESDPALLIAPVDSPVVKLRQLLAFNRQPDTSWADARFQYHAYQPVSGLPPSVAPLAEYSFAENADGAGYTNEEFGASITFAGRELPAAAKAVWLEADFRWDGQGDGLWVLSCEAEDYWQGVPLRAFAKKGGGAFRLRARYPLDFRPQPRSEFKLYLWNRQKGEVWTESIRLYTELSGQSSATD